VAFTPTLKAIGSAQKADSTELVANPRARSAVLRVAERLPDAGAGAAA
jgi:16S rRNA (cytosine1402-N4)-methyltransferase